MNARNGYRAGGCVLVALFFAACSAAPDSQPQSSTAPESPVTAPAAAPKPLEPETSATVPPSTPRPRGVHPDISPTISGYGSESFVFYSDGTGYTPNGNVWVGAVYNGNWVGHSLVTANSSGDIANGDFLISVCDETVTLEAYDYSTGDYSNTPQFFVDCTP